MTFIRRHLSVLALAVLLLPVSTLPLGAVRACATGPHTHEGAMAAECFMHHQTSERQQLTCGCFNDPSAMIAGPMAVIPAATALIPVRTNPRLVPGLDAHTPDFSPSPVSPPPR